MTRQLIVSAVLATLTLSSCGLAESLTETVDPTDPPATTEVAPAGPRMNIDTDGPTVCIDAALAKLGPDAMINEIDSHFEVGDDIDPRLVQNGEPPVPGDLSSCEAFYQDPSDPVTLLSIRMDVDTGEFGEPEPVEIRVSGDASEFDLNDYVMKASEVDTSAIQPTMDAQVPALDEAYSLWRWDLVNLEAPGRSSDMHTFNLHMEGRLAKNDIGEHGSISFTMDGSVVNDYLVP